MAYPIINQLPPVFSPIYNPLVLALLVFVVAFKCYHLLCVYYVIGSLCVNILGTKYKSICVVFFLVFSCFVLSTCVVLVFLTHASHPCGLGVMNTSTFLLVLLTLCQYCLSIKGIFWLVTLVSCISSCVHAVIHYYRTEFVTIFLAWKLNFNFKCLVTTCMWTLMGIAGSCGAGLPVILALLYFKRSMVKLLVLKYAFTIPYITLPLSDQSIQQTSMVHDSNPEICKSQNKTKRPRSIGKENACQGDNIPPPKRGRKNKSIDSEHRCGPCTVWLQTGSNEKLSKYHNMNNGRVRHPGD